jgi:hypothetical protein
MSKHLKITSLVIALSLLISSAASAAWGAGPALVSDSAHLLALGIGLISTGCLLRGRSNGRKGPRE